MFKNLIHPAVLFMNKLPFKIKIIVSISVLFILLILPSRTIFLDYFEQTKTYKNQLIGLSYSVKIQTLIQSIQMHRGLMNGYLNGNRSFKKELLKNEKLIEQKLMQLINYDRKKLDLLHHNKDFVNAMSKMVVVKLNNVNSHSTIKHIFKLHSAIISDLIKTLQNIAEVTSFATSSDLRVNYIAQLLQEKLLLLQENTGQLRGLGVGILLQDKITKEQKNTIFSLYTLLKSLENNIKENQVLSDMPSFLHLQKKTVLVAYKLDTILDIVYKNIITTDKPSYDSKKFFSQATEALNEQAELYKLFSYSYKVLIEEMQGRTLHNTIWAFAGFVLILLSALYLTGAFYQSIAESLKKLEIASQMIADGKTDIHLQADTRDELGNAILSFNDMSKKLNKNISFLDSYKMAIDETSIVSKTNSKGVITYINKKFCEISGYSQEELLGMPHNIVRHPESPKEVFADLWKTIKSKKIWKGIIKNRAKDGSTYIVDATIIPVLDNEGKIVEYIGIRHDITELEKSKEEIKKQKIDTLTGLPNRKQLLEDLQNIHKPILLYINIDDFANINDFYGAKIADNVLVHIAQLLRKMFVNGECRIYRFHNDEFFLLFEEHVLKVDKCEKVMDQIIEYIEHTTMDCDSKNCISVTLSGGISHYLHSANHEHLLSFAMIARKKAKMENKKFFLYHEEMNQESDYRKNIEWINKIKDAIDKDRIVPYFQPIIDNESGAITKYEALVRLIDADGSAISPYFFLSIAKKAKLYTKITKIVIDKTFIQLTKFSQYDFSINLTAEDINDDEIRTYIYEKLRECESAHHVIFEITESERISDYTQVNKFITNVKKYGVKIAIDDFGSGYANFEHIISLNADFIKIDGSLIKNIDTNKEASIVTEAIIAFSKKIGSKTVVEYVHSEKIYEKVKRLGADYSQGFYLGEPVAKINSLSEKVEAV